MNGIPAALCGFVHDVFKVDSTAELALPKSQGTVARGLPQRPDP